MHNIRLFFNGILIAYVVLIHYDQLIVAGNGDVALNCGSVVNSTALDGRKWVAESVSKYMSGESRTSPSNSLFRSGEVDPVPYGTSRISAVEFGYTFHLRPGQKFIRLHFYPANNSYRGFEKSVDYFSVKSGPFTLLRDYSASLEADTLGVEYIVKEFCVNIKENQQYLDITFSPSRIINTELKNKVYAFVNGIEIISMPTGLYYTPDSAQGARVVGLRDDRFHIIDDASTALEVIQRFNVGGSSITSIEDFGMFRRWNHDTNHLLEPRGGLLRVNHPALETNVTTDMPAILFIAPPEIFQTSWKYSGKSTRAANDYDQVYDYSIIRWKVPVDSGFGYLVRLHFCDLDLVAADGDQLRKEFRVFVNNQIAETNADVMRWSGGAGIPVHRDYVILLKGGEVEGNNKCDLLIALEAVDDDESVFEALKGLEIFKLSDLRNNLAAPNPVFPKRRMPASTNLKTQISSVIVTVFVTVVLILLGEVILLHRLRKSGDLEKSHDDHKIKNHRFTLDEIKSATQDFSDGCKIGRGGFGNVYKGVIPRVLGHETVAIKRLSPESKQGVREFLTEMETLSNLKLRHVNLVSLIGYCDEQEEMILVYEYVPRGTIADNLYKFSRDDNDDDDLTPLTWEQRLSICIGAAHGLDYLHTGSENGVIHRDVKDTNILLDENLVAKISDFGLSKLENINPSKSYLSTNVKGTAAYLDPHYLRTRRLTRKSDVYSFGVVMLVILSGKPATDRGILGEALSLQSRCQECLEEDDFSAIVDPCLLRGDISSDGLRKFVKIVEKCLDLAPKKRPSMAQVVADLERCHMGFASTAASGEERNNNNNNNNNNNILPHPPFQMQLEAPTILEESATVPPKEEITSRPTQNINAGGGKEYLRSRVQQQAMDSSGRVRKPRGWRRKIFKNKDPYKEAIISLDLESASESDTDWETYLPSDYQEILSGAVGPPLLYATKQELFHKLCHSPILINGGKLSFWLQSSGKKCYMMSARKLSIEWGDDPSHWSWKSIPESRFSEVAEIEKVYWLEIQGKILAQKLSLKTTYAAYIVVKVTEDSDGLDVVAEASAGKGSKRSSRRVRIVGSKDPQRRTDGWMEILLGKFFNDEGDGYIEMKLCETKTQNLKRGLIVEGIELRPEEDA